MVILESWAPCILSLQPPLLLIIEFLWNEISENYPLLRIFFIFYKMCLVAVPLGAPAFTASIESITYLSPFTRASSSTTEL